MCLFQSKVVCSPSSKKPLVKVKLEVSVVLVKVELEVSVVLVKVELEVPLAELLQEVDTSRRRLQKGNETAVLPQWSCQMALLCDV